MNTKLEERLERFAAYFAEIRLPVAMRLPDVIVENVAIVADQLACGTFVFVVADVHGQVTREVGPIAEMGAADIALEGFGGLMIVQMLL